jgi:hypothetical protein
MGRDLLLLLLLLLHLPLLGTLARELAVAAARDKQLSTMTI